MVIILNDDDECDKATDKLIRQVEQHAVSTGIAIILHLHVKLFTAQSRYSNSVQLSVSTSVTLQHYAKNDNMQFRIGEIHVILIRYK